MRIDFDDVLNKKKIVLKTHFLNKIFWFHYINLYISVFCFLIYFHFRNKNQIDTFLHASPRCPLWRADHMFGKKVSPIVFRQTFYPKIVSVAHIFSFTIMNYLNNSIRTKSLNTKECPTRLSPPTVKLSGFY